MLREVSIMATEHVEDRLLPLLRGELSAREAAAAEQHLATCPACAAARRDVEALALGLAALEPPRVHWGAYRAELREKMAPGAPGRARGAWGWMMNPARALAAAGLVAVMVYLGLPGVGVKPGSNGGGEISVAEDAILSSRLDLIASMEVVQRLDMLEDFDVIRRLDSLEG